MASESLGYLKLELRVDPAKTKSLPELTLRVVLLGLILSVVMGAANVYVGLKAGMTVSASIPAAVMAMLIFRMFRGSSILEANQVQTCASAGESLAAGIIFTMPAMIMIGHWTEFDFWTVTLVSFTGGLLGILFMIPMRRVFVVNNDELTYPEGVACASVLEAGQEASDQKSASSLIQGGLMGALLKLLGGFGLISDGLQTAKVVGSSVFYFGGNLSPMLVAVGFIVRLNVAVLIFIGGALAWLIGIPLMGGGDPNSATPATEQAVDIWKGQIRYVGVGAMVLGGFASLISVRHGLWAALQHLISGSKSTVKTVAQDRDIPTWVIASFGLGCAGLLGYLNFSFTGDLTVTAIATVIMLVLGFFFTAVASYIVGLVGNSNSPVSGMTITAVLVAGGILYLCNFNGPEAMVATLGIAAVVCCIACTSGDVCNDLKTGSMLGASPFRQQTMQIAGVAAASLIMAPIMNVLHRTAKGGIGGEELSAPQASLFASLAKGFSGEAELPWDLIGIGVGVGAVILVVDEILKRRQSNFRAHLMPIAVGMYLPFGLAVPILIGGLLAHFYSRGTPEEKVDQRLHRGILFSSGVVAGEALTAVGLALVALATNTKPSKLFALDGTLVGLLSIGAAIFIVVGFLRLTKPESND